MERLEKKFEGYTFKIDVPDSENFDPTNETVEVVLTTKTGEKYHANFITRNYESYLFEKNKRTGECAGGAYLWIPSRISVERITEKVVKTTIDDLIQNLEIERAFERIV
jgi:3'-phosphoadenosine 5'-phosphosulfate sulfotransferase